MPVDPDDLFMRAALRQARRGLGHTSPNPTVGAVVVQGGRVVGRGYHHWAGQPHAEVEALRALPHPSLAQGATLYVTLEPCSTHGRTPPCVEAILAAGLSRVVIGTIDPNPRHAGRGVALLRAAGVAVATGLREAECRALNRPFNHWMQTGRPWVVAKAGLSLDGRLTLPPGEGQWLTSPAARRDAQTLRAQVDAILIGAGTLRADDPRLTRRDPDAETHPRPQPWRVILTQGHTPLPAAARVFTDAHRERTLIFTGQPLPKVLAALGQRGVLHLLVEGGGTTLGAFFDAGLVDEVCFYLAPLLCGGPTPAVGGQGAAASAAAPHLEEVQYRRVGPDLRLRGLVRRAL